MEISKDFPGGNIKVLSVDGNIVKLENELRDSTADWFYWAFCVKGAQGKTLTFDLGKRYVGYFGAAVSTDLKTWRWSGNAGGNYANFTYTFKENESCVYFAHDLIYSVERFYDFASSKNLTVETLCQSEKGHDVPFVTFGKGDKVLLFTSRHHACESTGTYVMEGILSELLSCDLKDYKVIAIPFIDIDGVIAGDQGKNRAPHDHNRDYLDNPLYNSVKGVQKLASENNIVSSFDLHSPYHFGSGNDKAFLVYKDHPHYENSKKFGRLLQNSITKNSFKYSTENDLPAGKRWNIPEKMTMSCSGYLSQVSGSVAFTLETPYFGEPDINIATQENLVEFGRCFARAIEKRYL